MVRTFFTAMSFLTVIPVPQKWVGDERHLAAGVWLFPVVGTLLGLLAMGVTYGAMLAVPPLVAGVIVSFFSIAITGGLHLDGLSDSADGLLSARRRERMLEIMKDSRVGAMGVIAIVFAILSKTALLAFIFEKGTAIQAVLIMCIAGRCSILLQMYALPYARKENGIGLLFWQRNRWQLLFGLLFLFGFSAIDNVRGLTAAVTAVLFGFLFCRWVRGKIKGGTGDTLGALSELSEIAVLMSYTVWLHVRTGA